MQRTNRILMRSSRTLSSGRFYGIKGRNGFALLTAVFLMIIIASMLLTMISQSSETQSKTMDSYLNEQAILLTYSATEYAMLAISGRDRLANGCITTINSTYPTTGDPMFNITTNIQYIWSNDASLDPADSSVGLAATNCTGYIDNLATPESTGAARIDVFVTTAPGLGMDQPISFHRRTLQKL